MIKLISADEFQITGRGLVKVINLKGEREEYAEIVNKIVFYLKKHKEPITIDEKQYIITGIETMGNKTIHWNLGLLVRSFVKRVNT